eukprot:1343891-Rhodomonas_salina.1
MEHALLPLYPGTRYMGQALQSAEYDRPGHYQITASTVAHQTLPSRGCTPYEVHYGGLQAAQQDSTRRHQELVTDTY